MAYSLEQIVSADFSRDIDKNTYFRFQKYIYNTSGIDLNVLPVYEDYTGAGVLVAVADQSIDHTHPDLAPNYDASRDYDFVEEKPDATLDDGDEHGTAVAGVIAAANDGAGLLGVAFDATVSGLRVISNDPGSATRGGYTIVADALTSGANFDIVNNSYGFGPYYDSFTVRAPQMEAALAVGAELGRDGLGTVYVFAAGNGGYYDENLAGANLQADRRTIAVGATDSNGDLTSFSTPGAAVLVSAQGRSVVTTDAVGREGYVDGSVVAVSGTSFSAPMVSGVVALMLEANPALGYRDVQKILAITARNTDPTAFAETGAEIVNGGGLNFSDGYGFGVVDAAAAVRLAETWDAAGEGAGTAATEQMVEVENVQVAGLGSAAVSFSVSGGLRIQHVELDVSGNGLRDIDINLISPDGTVSGVLAGSYRAGMPYGPTTLRLNSVEHLFEDIAGTWRLEVVDDYGDAIDLSVDLRFYGDSSHEGDTHYFTDEYGLYASDDAARRQLRADVAAINAGAVSTALSIDLGANSFEIDGVAGQIDESAAIGTVVAGDGDDLLRGDSQRNELLGGRGADRLEGAAGDDVLTGGAGDDTLLGGSGADTAVFRGVRADFTIEVSSLGVIRVTHEAGDGVTSGFNDGVDALQDIEFLRFSDVTVDVAALSAGGGDEGGGSTDEPDDGPDDEAPGDAPTFLPRQFLEGDAGDNEILGARGIDIVRAFAGNDLVRAFGGDDRLNGGEGDDWMVGGGGDDMLRGAGGADRLIGGEGDDVLVGGLGDDTLLGRQGDDSLLGGGGADRLVGGAGADRLTGMAGNDRLIGGAGADIFIFAGAFGWDVITDFNAAEDALDFSAITTDGGVLRADMVDAGVVIWVNEQHRVLLRDAALGDVMEFDFL